MYQATNLKIFVHISLRIVIPWFMLLLKKIFVNLHKKFISKGENRKYPSSIQLEFFFKKKEKEKENSLALLLLPFSFHCIKILFVGDFVSDEHPTPFVNKHSST